MYQSVGTINNLLLEIKDKKYILPAIQREFVWKPEQICQLFDSMMQGYPFGTFLFWKVKEDKVNEFKFYQFMQNFDEKNNYLCSVYDNIPQKDHIAVLDGQQRITSLNIALRGSYTIQVGHKTKEMFLYFNVLGQGDPDHNALYDFKFLTQEEASVKNEQQYWILVSEMLDGVEPGSAHGKFYPILMDITKFIGTFPEYAQHPEKVEKLNIPKKITHLISTLNMQNLIFAYEEKEQNLEKVLNIFIRMNSGGTPLSYSDLLLSFAVTQWSTLNARDEINELLKEIEENTEFEFSKDLILRAGLMLSEVNNLSFKLSNFNKDNMRVMENNWEQIKLGFISSSELLKEFGFDHKALIHDVAILPIVYFVYHKYCVNLDLDKAKIKIDSNDIQLMKRWLIESLLKKGIWSSNLESLLLHIRKAIGKTATVFPYEAVKQAMLEKDKALSFNEEDVQNLCQLRYGKDNEIKALLLLVFPDSQLVRTHIDHIYPKSIFTPKKMQKLKIVNDGSNKLQNLANTVVNLQLIPESVNIQKNATQPAQWLESFFMGNLSSQQLYLTSQLIDQIPQDLNQFEWFCQQRREKICTKLRNLLDVKPVNNSIFDYPELGALKLSKARFSSDQIKFLDKLGVWLNVENESIDLKFMMNVVMHHAFNTKVNSQPADSIKASIIMQLLDVTNAFDKTKDLLPQAYQSGYFMIDDASNLTSFEMDDFINRDLEAFLNHAEERSVTIIKARCGIDGVVGQTLEQVGQSLDLTRERIRQVEKNAFQNLRERVRISVDVIWENLNQNADSEFMQLYPKLASHFSNQNDLLNFLELLCSFDKNELVHIIKPNINVNSLLQEWFLHHKAPMPWDTAIHQIVDLAGCTERVAKNAIHNAAENADILFSDQTKTPGIYPKNLNKMYAVVHAALHFKDGANFKEILERANQEGYSKVELSTHRLDHSINEAVEENYLYQSDRGAYCHINEFNISFADQELIFKEVLAILSQQTQQQSMHLRMEAYEVSDTLKQYDYFKIRHLIRNWGVEHGIYFTGKSGADTISLNEAVKPQSQLQTILNWLEQSSRPLTRDDIAKKIRSGSQNHASLYLNELMQAGSVVRVAALEYTTPQKAYKNVDIHKLHQDIVAYLKSVNKPVDIGIIAEKVNLKYHYNYPKAWYLHLVKTSSKDLEAQNIHTFHNLISLDETIHGVTIHQMIRDNFKQLDDLEGIHRFINQQILVGKTEVYNAMNNIRNNAAVI